ncbi:hypothetical protein [Neobacillus sp. YIM B06451]|uniref:hypothetical protein n=1 Tax=Neobacillus sp. YIM B06451 TaxID=3070994 RepID=UPI0029311BAA|nr:hypothetical protein [Neobacillus sp. YIM B06451]
MGVFEFFTGAAGIVTAIISWKALLSKSDLEQVFLTHEQKIKLYYLKLISLSGLIAFLFGDLYILWSLTFKGKTAATADWNFAIALGFVVFICCLITLGAIEKVIQNLVLKSHTKYKVTLENIGEVYILKMMNEQLCICSKNPNADFYRNDIESILVRLEDLIQKPLIRVEIEVPKRPVLKKLFD